MAVASHLDAAYPQLKRPGPGLAAYLALLRLGVTVPRLVPDARWALTPPCHPCPWMRGGLFSVALSVALRRPGVTWQSTLWSSDFPQHAHNRRRTATIAPCRHPAGNLSVPRVPRQVLARHPPQQPPHTVVPQAFGGRPRGPLQPR